MKTTTTALLTATVLAIFTTVPASAQDYYDNTYNANGYQTQRSYQQGWRNGRHHQQGAWNGGWTTRDVRGNDPSFGNRAGINAARRTGRCVTDLGYGRYEFCGW